MQCSAVLCSVIQLIAGQSRINLLVQVSGEKHGIMQHCTVLCNTIQCSVVWCNIIHDSVVYIAKGKNQISFPNGNR